MLLQKQVDKFIMNLNVADGGISNVLYHVGERELAFMSLLRETVEEGMTCVDLGSNIGYTTLFMLDKVGETGRVYAIEPDPNNLGLLQSNIRQNNYTSICEVTQCAISDTDGQLDFWQASAPNLSSITKHKNSTHKITVDSFCLNTFLSSREYPNFLKMDVEGGEVKIFEGGLDYFTKNRGTTHFLVEVHPATYNEENDFEAILKKYFEIGFSPKYVVTTPVPQPTLFAEAGYTPARTVETDGFHRGVYDDISNEHLLEFACREHQEGRSKKIVRSFMLSREE
tara:strand:- start:57602 stop:58450 length:849 start_codon:yes stop_codon:yes gene_type:complete